MQTNEALQMHPSPAGFKILHFDSPFLSERDVMSDKEVMNALNSMQRVVFQSDSVAGRLDIEPDRRQVVGLDGEGPVSRAVSPQPTWATTSARSRATAAPPDRSSSSSPPSLHARAAQR